MDKDQGPVESKVIPINPRVARELQNYVGKSFDLVSQGEPGASNEMWQEEFKAWLDGSTLKSLFFSEDWVFIITDLVANKVSSQPLRVMKRTVVNGKEVAEPAPEHPLNELLEQPNEWQDYSQWMYNTVVELTLMGNAIMWHAPTSGQILTLPTDCVTIDFNIDGTIKSYVLNQFKEDATGMREVDALNAFDPKDIAHIRRPNPNSLIWGLSPFIPGRKSVLFNRYSTDYLNAFYLKQATPGLALTIGRNVNEDVALRQMRSFEVAYQGRKAMRRTLILPKDVSVQTLTHSLADQKLLDHIDKNRETICGLLKVPKHEVGLQTSSSLGSEEYKTALRNFWEATLIPTMRLIEGTMDKFFQVELGEEFFFEFDLSGVEALKADLMKQAEMAAQMLQAGLSVNEVRARVWETEESQSPDADVPFVLRETRQFPGAAPAEDSEETAEPEDEVEDEENKTLVPDSNKLQMDGLTEIRGILTKQLDEEEARKIEEESKRIIELLVGFTGKALDVIEESNKATGAFQVKQLPPKSTLRRRIEKALKQDFEEEYVTGSTRTLSSSVELGYDQQLSFVFNAEAEREIEALRARDSEGRRLTLEARGLRSFADISKTHTERIMSEITKGQRENESITDIMRRVANSLGTPGQLAGRAETIARTETLTAVSIGQGAAIENAEEVIPGLKKAWLSAGDNRVRDSHVALDGDVVASNKRFGNGLRFPRDPDSSDPAEVINCRCTVLMILPEE